MNNLLLNKLPLDKWFHNLVVFLAPLAVLYITTAVGTISADKAGFQIKDLIPNAFAMGGLVLYVLNTVQDYLRKLNSQ
jgi:hypothetical protein